jgi:hypothetical protein
LSGKVPQNPNHNQNYQTDSLKPNWSDQSRSNHPKKGQRFNELGEQRQESLRKNPPASGATFHNSEACKLHNFIMALYHLQET